MKVLRFEELSDALGRGELIAQGTADNIQAASYDLRVGTLLRDGQIIGGGHPDANRQFLIRPGELVTLFTLEELRLPPDVAGFAFAMNSLSSEGLLVMNPGHIDPGYEGPLTVRALNLRKTPITLSREMSVFTVVLVRLHEATTHPYPRNRSRVERERHLHAREAEIAPASISDLLRNTDDLPVVSAEVVDRQIRNHWMTRTSFVATLVAALAALILLALTLRSSTAVGRPATQGATDRVQSERSVEPLGTVQESLTPSPTAPPAPQER